MYASRGGIMHNAGYRYIKSPDHPRANSNGYVAEHRLVMEEKIGRLLTAREVVHHNNENRSDNRIENLELVESRGKHAVMHGHIQRAWIVRARVKGKFV